MSNFSMEITKKLFEDVKEFFDQNKISKIKKKFNNSKIVFICGLPRSGIYFLVNQILTSHSKVESVFK